MEYLVSACSLLACPPPPPPPFCCASSCKRASRIRFKSSSSMVWDRLSLTASKSLILPSAFSGQTLGKLSLLLAIVVEI